MAAEHRRALLVCAGVLAGILIVACGGDGALDQSAAPDSLKKGTGHTVEFEGHNFQLPQWGGINSARLTIGPRGAFGEVERTGDGRYEVVTYVGETFFRRVTCDHFARIPGGGGAEVFALLVSASEAAKRATGKLTGPPPGITRAVKIDGFGTGDIEVDPDSGLVRMAGLTPRGEVFEISFSNWGANPVISKPADVTGDELPGGDPC